MKSRFARPLLGLLTLACASIATAGINSWTPEGPYGAGANQMAVHPTQPNNLLLSTTNGLYASANAGVDWTLVRADWGNASIVYDPAHPGRVYVAYNGLHRSDDNAASFTALPDVANRPHSIAIAANGDLYGINSTFALSRSSDLGQSWTPLPRPWAGNQRVEFVLDPNDSNVVYVYINDVGTYRSGDRGATWTPPTPGSPGTNVGAQSPRDVFWFVVQPGNSNRLLAATGRGIRISNDAGATWSDAAFVRFAYWIGFHPVDPQRVIAIGLHGEIMRSEDGGATWPLNQNGADPRVYSYSRGAIDPSTPGRLWATSANGPILSSDWGATFTLRTGDLRMGYVADFATTIDGNVFAGFSSPVGVYRRNGSQWNRLDISTLMNFSDGINIQRFAAAPGDANVLYAGNIDRMLARSLDGGATWATVSFTYPAIGASLPSAMVVSPVNSSVVFVATSNLGAWRSADGGVNWTQLASLPNVVSTISFDPAAPNVMYAGAGSFMTDAVYKSTDGGTNWSPTGTLPAAGLSSGGYPNSIVVDPADSNVVWVTASSHLYKSTNAGASWASVSMGGTPNVPMNSNLLLIDPAIPTTVFGSASPGVQTLSRSVDGGATWELLPFNAGNAFTVIYEAVLDPQRPNRVIANPSMLGLMTFEVAPDLAVSLAGFDTPLLVGSNEAVSVAVVNRGPFASSASEVRLTLPSWVTPVVPANCTRAANVLTCSVGVLRVDQTATIPLTLAVAAAPATGTVTATVEGHETDSNGANDSATLNASSAREADLQLTFGGLATTIPRTSSARLTSTLRNAGPSAAPATQVTYDVPAGLAVTAATSTAGTCTTAGATVTCQLGEVAVDATATITIDVRGDVSGSYVVTGNATAQVVDANGTQNVVTGVTVIPLADARIQVTESAGAKIAGTPFTYNVALRNDGPDALNLTASLTLTGATVTAATTTGAGGVCSVTAPRGQCVFTAVPAGTELSMTVTVNAAAAGSVTAAGLAFVQGGTDPAPANNEASVTSTVAAPPSPPGSGGGGGGKGGGGRLDWLGLLLLGGYAAARGLRIRSIA